MTFVHLPFSVRSLDLSCLFTRAHEAFMMCNKEVASRIQPVDCAVTIFYFRYVRFPLLSARRLKEFDTSVICHVIMYCLGSFLLQDMFLDLQEFAFEGQNMKLTVNMLLTCFLYCAPGLAVIRTVC